MANHPVDISIVTTAHNRANLLPRVWNSLKDQTPSFEWIVVDDASKDDTTEVVKSFRDERIVYVRHPEDRGGPSAGRNQGAKMARGRYVVFLDDDDELYPGSMAQMVSVMDNADPSIGVVLFQCVLSGGSTWDEEIVDGAVYDEADIVCRHVLGLEKICLYRTEVFDHYELPEDLCFSENVFVFAVAKKYKFMMTALPGRVYHRDATSASRAKPMIAKSRLIAMGYERILHNHQEVLRDCPEAKAFYTMKALYRYAVADCRADAWRMFRLLLRYARPKDIILGFGILLLGLSGAAKIVETIRIPMIHRITLAGNHGCV